MIEKRSTKAGKPRYLVRLYRGRDPVSGKRQYAFETFKTRKEAKRWERKQLHSLDTGTFVEPTQMRLGVLLAEWLAGAAKLALGPRSLGDCRELIGRYITPHDLATVPVARLATADLERFYAELGERGGAAGKPLGARTVRMVHGVLHAALAKAARPGVGQLLRANPAAGATLPRQERREMQALDVGQVGRLLATSDATDNRWHALWHLLTHGGLRPSEALALKWSDVGPDRVHVRRTLVVGRKGGGWKVEDPKTRGSRRVVTLPAATMEALAWHRTRQEAEKLAAGSRYRDDGFVFAGQGGGPLSLPNLTARHFKPLLGAYYPLPPIRLYDLRHTHASLLLAAGVPVNVVSARLGHASAKMTLDIYAHVLSGQQEDAVAKLQVYLAGSR